MIKKIFNNIPAVLAVLFFLWVSFSWFDIVADNNALQPVHNNLNFFVVCLEVFAK